MKIMKERWEVIFAETKRLDRIIKSRALKRDREYEDMVDDADIAKELMKISEVIVIPSSTILELIYNIDRIDCRGQLHLPYPHVLIQFTSPIPEVDIMAHSEVPEELTRFSITSDSVEGICLGNSYQYTGKEIRYTEDMMNSVAFFTSTAVNRVAWKDAKGFAVPHWEIPSLGIKKESFDNKMRLIRLAYLIDLFLNAPNIIVQKTVFDVRVQRKREQKGKAKLPEYHTVIIEKMQVEYSGKKGTGSPHGRMYPVRGHFRKYKHLDKPVWIANHFRGLSHADSTMMKDVYKVKPIQDKSSKG